MPEIGAFCCQFPYLEVTLSSMDFTGGSDGKESACTAGDLGSLPGLKRSPGGGHGNPLQYSCLQNPMDIGAWQATVLRVTKSQTRQVTEYAAFG